MSSKSDDKKKQILRTAMQLFATKGSSATSMQEIAEVCGMSKGSLYLHFKSKEELEHSLYNYCFQMLQDHLVEVESQPGLSPRDRMIRQIEVLLMLVLEFREFFLMQLKEVLKSGNMHKEPEVIRGHTTKLLKFSEKTILAAYSEKASPYFADLLSIIHGMLGTYVQLLLVPKLNISTSHMARYLVDMLDVIVANLLQTQPEPLISRDLIQQWSCTNNLMIQSERHPLLAIKELKTLVPDLVTDSVLRDQGLESLQILDQEMIELHPRHAILLGMLANLKNIPEIKLPVAELEELIQPYLHR